MQKQTERTFQSGVLELEYEITETSVLVPVLKKKKKCTMNCILMSRVSPCFYAATKRYDSH